MFGSHIKIIENILLNYFPIKILISDIYLILINKKR